MEQGKNPSVKKGLKEYLLEGLMIFVAVSMGFIAENIREDLADNEKEIKYIRSFYSDLSEDEKNLEKLVRAIQIQSIQAADSVMLLADSLNTGKYDNHFYSFSSRLIRQQGIRAYVTDRTMDEIKNASEMKLIKNKLITDSLLDYYKEIVLLDYFQNILLGYKAKLKDDLPYVFDAKEYSKLYWEGVDIRSTSLNGEQLHLLKPDKTVMNRILIEICDIGGLSRVIQRNIIKQQTTASSIKKMMDDFYQLSSN
jgi:hypothetical protein